MTNKRTQKLGQHMLVDTEVIDYEIAMARLEDKAVLEIGGGTGNLTEALEKNAKKVTVIEKDQMMIDELKDKFKGKRKIKIIRGDFLEISPGKYEVEIIIGNIPYSVSSQIIFKLREWKFEHALLCVQKEFAERMIAKPGDRNYSRLSIMSQIYFKTTCLRDVPKTCFDPVPEVDSAIVLLFPKDEKINEKRDELITKLFVHRKKTLAAAIKSREFTEDERKNILSRAEKERISNKRVFHLTTEEIFLLTGS